jgi:hypothetical protein
MHKYHGQNIIHQRNTNLINKQQTHRLMTAAKEISKYTCKLHFVGVQEVRAAIAQSV